MAFKDIFKRKEGGSMFGNMLRATSNKISGGLLGNGAMKLKPGETIDENNSIVAQKVGAGAIAFNELNPSGNKESIALNIDWGAKKQWFKNNWYYVVFPVVIIVAVVVYFTKKSKRKGRR